MVQENVRKISFRALTPRIATKCQELKNIYFQIKQILPKSTQVIRCIHIITPFSLLGLQETYDDRENFMFDISCAFHNH